MATPSDVARRIRERVGSGISRGMTDFESLTIGLAASCGNAPELFEYLLDRQLAKELNLLKAADVAVTLPEFQTLFSSFRPLRADYVAAVANDCAFQLFVKNLQTQLQCTITERDQRAAWSIPAIRVLAYVAIHADVDTEDRMSCALGGVVRADLRRLEDLRASVEGEAMDVMSVGSSISSLVRSLLF